MTAGTIAAVAILHDCGVTLAGVIGNYLRRVVAPLMAKRLLLFKMVVEAPSDGSRLSALLPSDAEIARWLTEAMEVWKGADGAVVPYVLPVPGCPPICPELGIVEFVNLSSFTLPSSSSLF